MEAIHFEEANKALLPGNGGMYPANVSEVVTLHVWTDGVQCVSCWRMSWKERLSALLFGTVWLNVLSFSETQPPVWIGAEKNIFGKEAKSDKTE